MSEPSLKIIVEKHSDVYIAYPLGLARGVIVGQGDSYEEAMTDVRSAIAFHSETFGVNSLGLSDEGAVIEAFVAETVMPV